MADFGERAFEAMEADEMIALRIAIQSVMIPPNYLLEDDEEENILEMMSEEIREERNSTPRIEGFVERTVPSFSAAEFQSHFRMLPETFNVIMTEIGGSLNSKSLGRERITAEKQLLMALWRLATPDSYRSICQRFGVGKATAIRAVRRVCHSLNRLAPKYILWPSGGAVALTIEGFQQGSGFPGVIGAIDGTHIGILAPKENPEAYVNRKGYHSIHLQAVCDSRSIFTHCYVGNVGSVHDARVFRLSSVNDYLADPAKFPNDSHIIGDSAYGLHPQLLTPYADNGHLTRRQKNYKFCHSSARMAIERAFGLLKGRWRCLLDTLTMQIVEEIPYVVMSACVLHNICLLQKDRLLALAVGQPPQNRHQGLFERGGEGRGIGIAKRNNICHNLPMRDV